MQIEEVMHNPNVLPLVLVSIWIAITEGQLNPLVIRRTLLLEISPVTLAILVSVVPTVLPF